MYRHRLQQQFPPVLAMIGTMALRRTGLRGFTLIELMITIAIAAALLKVAAPSFTSFMRNSTLTSATNTLLTAINTARSEAIKTGMNAYVIPNGSAWSAGWLVFVDLDNDGNFTASSDRTVLEQAAPASFITITANGNAAATPPYVKFNSSGYASNKGVVGSPGTGNLTFSLARNDVSSNAEIRRVVVGRSGRARACTPSTDSSCTSSAAQ